MSVVQQLSGGAVIDCFFELIKINLCNPRGAKDSGKFNQSQTAQHVDINTSIVIGVGPLRVTAGVMRSVLKDRSLMSFLIDYNRELLTKLL